MIEPSESNKSSAGDDIRSQSVSPNYVANHRADVPTEDTLESPSHRYDTSTVQSASTYQSVVPRVEWVYPPDYEGHREEHGSIDISNVAIPTVNLEDRTNRSSRTLTIDASQTMVIPTIDGRIVSPRRCYVKIYGFRICDDSYTTKINPWILVLALIFTVTASIRGGLLHSQLQSDNLALTKLPSMIPSMAPSFDARSLNITEKLYIVSGDVIYDIESPQNKALIWILYEDEMYLAHESHHLVQRYVLMVLYYSMLGEKWTKNFGYGSDIDECDWYGIECKDSSCTTIRLENNFLQGKIPHEIGHLSRLERILLAKNRISGSIPSSMGMLTKLNHLSLFNNNLIGTLPDEMEGCKRLKDIRIYANSLSGSIHVFFRDLPYLRIARLDFNRFTGTIPSNLSNLRNLQHIDLEENELTGAIPSELGVCASLEHLQLNKNKLGGTIPSSLGNLSLLKSLIFSNNRITGTVPEELSRLTNLNIFSLRDNQLIGTIPGALGSLSNIFVMDLSENMMNGTIPSSFDSLDNLNTFKIHDNLITGEISEKICGFSLITMTADCLGMEAKVSCLCCTKCY